MCNVNTPSDTRGNCDATYKFFSSAKSHLELSLIWGNYCLYFQRNKKVSFYERNIKVSLMTIFGKKTAARKFRKEGSRFQSETTKRIRYRLYLMVSLLFGKFLHMKRKSSMQQQKATA